MTFEPAPGYIMTDVPKITPEQIRVSGARDALTRIFEIPTDSIRFDSLSANDNFKVKLNLETFPAYVTPSDSSVIMSIDIQKLKARLSRRYQYNLSAVTTRTKPSFRLIRFPSISPVAKTFWTLSRHRIYSSL